MRPPQHHQPTHRHKDKLFLRKAELLLFSFLPSSSFSSPPSPYAPSPLYIIAFTTRLHASDRQTKGTAASMFGRRKKEAGGGGGGNKGRNSEDELLKVSKRGRPGGRGEGREGGRVKGEGAASIQERLSSACASSKRFSDGEACLLPFLPLPPLSLPLPLPPPLHPFPTTLSK